MPGAARTCPEVSDVIAPEDPLHSDVLDYTPLPKSVTLARRRAHRLLTEWGHPELAADAALLVSELGGNAVLHGSLRDRLFRVALTLTERAVRISVSDPKGELRPNLREATVDDMFGRGLLIVGQVADRWGVCELTVGKSVWCELDVVRQAVSADYRGASEAPPRRRTTMAEPLKTLVNGVEVEVPNSIPDIRATLPEGRREEFDRAINEAGVHDIHAVMRHWMLEAVPDPEAEALLERLAADEAERRGAA
jgi:anti-sigma regulatory factor (Ser/Thr protein kinase)